MASGIYGELSQHLLTHGYKSQLTNFALFTAFTLHTVHAVLEIDPK
jgi:hypothetical protein